jgi:AcrR family transcriptional regulator
MIEMSTRIRKKQSEKAQGQLRREPQQQRSRATREVILDAAVAVLKTHGPSTMNTNRVAEKAGVSIGSLYQYFTDKQAIYTALHERHVVAANQLITTVCASQARLSFEQSIHLLIEGLIDLHITDLELCRLLLNETPHQQTGMDQKPILEELLNDLLVTQISPTKLATKSVVIATTIDALIHSLVLKPSSGLTIGQLLQEVEQIILGYVGHEGMPCFNASPRYS